ncbi:MAG: four helix bundle protein, partial [candidate division WOR-3 bacterium]|nr:four helix bundle protein [candidate division WOR-3 bacterium]
MEKGYKTLKIYELLHKLAIMVHKMTLSLPKLELFKEGSQCRRSSKSVS